MRLYEPHRQPSKSHSIDCFRVSAMSVPQIRFEWQVSNDRARASRFCNELRYTIAPSSNPRNRVAQTGIQTP